MTECPLPDLLRAYERPRAIVDMMRRQIRSQAEAQLVQIGAVIDGLNDNLPNMPADLLQAQATLDQNTLQASAQVTVQAIKSKASAILTKRFGIVPEGTEASTVDDCQEALQAWRQQEFLRAVEEISPLLQILRIKLLFFRNHSLDAGLTPARVHATAIVKKMEQLIQSIRPFASKIDLIAGMIEWHGIFSELLQCAGIKNLEAVMLEYADQAPRLNEAL